MAAFNLNSTLFDYEKTVPEHSPLAQLTEPLNINLIDFLYDGFYLVFLIKNGYIPNNPKQFKEKVLTLLTEFAQQAKKNQYSSNDIDAAQYAYCALLDEIIVSAQNSEFSQLQNIWLVNPLQLSLFGSQLAGHHFFEYLEQVRSKGKDRLASLEVFHYCLLLGFQGKYRLGSIESLNHLTARVGDEIDYLKGKKSSFAPFATLPDQVKNILHRELPFFWVCMVLLVFSLALFLGLQYMLSQHQQGALAPYSNVIRAPMEQAHITIYLP